MPLLFCGDVHLSFSQVSSLAQLSASLSGCAAPLMLLSTSRNLSCTRSASFCRAQLALVRGSHEQENCFLWPSHHSSWHVHSAAMSWHASAACVIGMPYTRRDALGPLLTSHRPTFAFSYLTKSSASSFDLLSTVARRFCIQARRY